MTGDATHAPSRLGSNSWSHLRTFVGCNFVSPNFDSRGLGFQVNDWFGAAKKNLLSNANKMLLDMQEYDKDNIPDKVIAVRT